MPFNDHRVGLSADVYGIFIRVDYFRVAHSRPWATRRREGCGRTTIYSSFSSGLML
jgi:hypothetical protein